MQQVLTCKTCNKEIESKCLACIEKELVNWRPTKAIEFSEKVTEFKDELKTEKLCGSCNSTVNVCSECFHTYIYNWLQQEDPFLAEEFVVFFNLHN